MTWYTGGPKPEGRAAVYRLFAADGELLYIGCSNNPDSRCKAHRHRKPWWREVAKRTDEWYETRDAADAAETDAIKAEKPKYNVRGTPLASRINDGTVTLTEEENLAWVRTWDKNFHFPPTPEIAARSKVPAAAKAAGLKIPRVTREDRPEA